MNRQRLFSMLCYLFISNFLIINGCSNPILKFDKDKPLPPIIKAYKHISLTAGFWGMKNTGVFVDEGDIYTIMATGSMDYCPGRGCGRNNVRPEDGWPIMARIGKDGYRFMPISKGHNSGTVKSYDSGHLFIGYKQGKVDRRGKN